MENNICKVCEKNYSLYKVEFDSKDPLPICMRCLNTKMETGEIKLTGKQRVDFLEKMSASIREENSENIGKNQSANNPKKQTHEVIVKTQETQKARPIYALQFGYDLTEKARNNELDPTVGREAEIENTIRIMKRRFKNNPILVGEPGVGKTAIVEGIAKRIASGNVSNNLKDKKIISLSMGNLIAGTKYRGEFEDRIKKIIEETKERGDLILFFDEFHTIMNGGGGEGSVDAVQMLKPPLSRGEIQIIGATTLDEYRLSIEKDRALERRFQRVKVAEPTEDESFHIIEGLKQQYENYHNISIPTEVVKEAISLSQRYITDRMLPDKAIDLLDEACAHKQLSLVPTGNQTDTDIEEMGNLVKEKEAVLSNSDFAAAKAVVAKEKKLKKEITAKNAKIISQSVISTDDIAHILQMWTGIPAKKMTRKEKDKLQSFQSEMQLRVKGQDKAIEVLSKSIKRNSVGLKDANSPVGVFMMLGPTGVGKTEMTKALTELLLGDEKKMIRFDMSEYMEKHSVSKLIGAPPGYAGYEDEGKLTKSIRQNPYSVVLFDEIEKAHPDIMNVLLQLFDEGRISNAKGREVDARNCIFIMTSNVGSDLYSSKKTAIGYDESEETREKDLEKQIRERLKSEYRPEFLNRIDDFLIFNKLSKTIMEDIAVSMVDELKYSLAKKGVNATISKSAVDIIAEKGFDPEMGARPLKREINKLKNLIADTLIDKEDTSKISIGARAGKIYVK